MLTVQMICGLYLEIAWCGNTLNPLHYVTHFSDSVIFFFETSAVFQ